jgi:hypothetical protein
MAYSPVKYGLMSGVGRGLGRAGESIARGMMAGYARDERERVRAEDLRRYEAQRTLEAARHKERLDRQEELDRRSAFGLQQKFLTEPKDPAQIESYMKEFQRRGITGASDPGTLGPTRMPEVPMYEDVRVPYDIEAVREPMGPSEVPGPLVTPTEEQINLMRTLGVPLDKFGDPHASAYGYKLAGSEPIEFGDVIESQVRRPPIPAQAGYRTEQRFNPLGGPAYDAPPTQPMARGAYDALMARREAEEAELHRKTRGDLASMIGKVAPLVAAEVTQEGHVDEPVTPEHYRDLVRRSREEELWRTKANEAAKVVARRAASRGKHRIDLLNGYASFISKSLRNNDKAGLTAGVVEMRRLIGGDEKDSVSAAEDIWGAKASKDRTQLGRVMWTTTAPVLRDEIRTANAQIRALVGQPAALLTQAGRDEIGQLRGSVSRAKNELKRLGHQAGLSPEVITLEIDAGPKSEDDFLGLAKQWADTWGLTLEQSADRLRDMGYEIE